MRTLKRGIQLYRDKTHVHREAHPIKVCSWVVFSIFAELCVQWKCDSRTLCHLEKKPQAHQQKLLICSSLHPWQPYFLSLWICLFWTFCINWLIQYGAFWQWALFKSSFPSLITKAKQVHWRTSRRDKKIKPSCNLLPQTRNNHYECFVYLPVVFINTVIHLEKNVQNGRNRCSLIRCKLNII